MVPDDVRRRDRVQVDVAGEADGAAGLDVHGGLARQRCLGRWKKENKLEIISEERTI